MELTFSSCKAHGVVTAPPSKSCSHRELICAALAGAGSSVSNISFSQDILATLDCISALGGEYETTGHTVTFHKEITKSSSSVTLKCRESGSTLRFFVPIAIVFADGAEIIASERLYERGISIYEETLADKGITFHKENGVIKVSGNLRAGDFTLRGDVSSQYISGLLFALPFLDGDSTIKILPPVESRGYIDLTVDTLHRHGIKIRESKNTLYIPGKQQLLPFSGSVEGDWSNAAFFLAFNFLDGDVTVNGLDKSTLQSDKRCIEFFQQLMCPGAEIDISGCPDLAPILFTLAAAEFGGVFTGTHRLKLKESDRAQAMADELKKLSVDVSVEKNRVILPPSHIKKPYVPLCSHNDHRIAMALSILLTLTGGTLTGAECVNKSYPDFFDVLKSLNIEIK